jgi:hypothetical protein
MTRTVPPGRGGFAPRTPSRDLTKRGIAQWANFRLRSAPALASRRASATLHQKLASLFAMNLDHQSTISTLRQIPSYSITNNLHPEHITRKQQKTSSAKQPIGLINNTN